MAKITFNTTENLKRDFKKEILKAKLNEEEVTTDGLFNSFMDAYKTNPLAIKLAIGNILNGII